MFEASDKSAAYISSMEGQDSAWQLGPLRTKNPIRPTLENESFDGLGEREIAEKITEGRIKQARTDAEWFDLDTLDINPEKRLSCGEFAFLVHPRDLSDIPLQFPSLSLDYLTEDEIRQRFREIPPFRASRITGLADKDGREMKGWLVISTIMPDQIARREELPWVKRNILQIAKLAYMLGADILGLGAMSATLTHLGKTIEDELPELHVTTGHSYTSFLIKETLLEAARRTRKNLEKSTVAVVGAAGSIGRSVAHLVLPEVGSLLLIDTEVKAGKLKNFLEDEQKYNPRAQIQFLTTRGTNDPNYFALQKADFAIFATTQIEPFVKAEWLKRGAIIIDDSAPVNVADGVAESRGGMTLHVVANTPGKLNFNFDFKLAEGSIFGCGAEVAALAALHQFDQGVTGEVSNGSVDRIAKAAQMAGFRLGSFQSFGKLKSADLFSRKREFRKVVA